MTRGFHMSWTARMNLGGHGLGSAAEVGRKKNIGSIKIGGYVNKEIGSLF